MVNYNNNNNFLTEGWWGGLREFKGSSYFPEAHGYGVVLTVTDIIKHRGGGVPGSPHMHQRWWGAACESHAGQLLPRQIRLCQQKPFQGSGEAETVALITVYIFQLIFAQLGAMNIRQLSSECESLSRLCSKYLLQRFQWEIIFK